MLSITVQTSSACLSQVVTDSNILFCSPPPHKGKAVTDNQDKLWRERNGTHACTDAQVPSDTESMQIHTAANCSSRVILKLSQSRSSCSGSISSPLASSESSEKDRHLLRLGVSDIAHARCLLKCEFPHWSYLLHWSPPPPPTPKAFVGQERVNCRWQETRGLYSPSLANKPYSGATATVQSRGVLFCLPQASADKACIVTQCSSLLLCLNCTRLIRVALPFLLSPDSMYNRLTPRSYLHPRERLIYTDLSSAQSSTDPSYTHLIISCPPPSTGVFSSHCKFNISFWKVEV